MTAEVLIPWLTSQFFANNGQFLAGGLLYTYQAGTNTAAPTYTDSTGSTPNANPVVANSRGEMSVWFPANIALKFVLTDAAGNTIWTRDQVVNTQLISLFAGTDTGSSSLYILTFATPFSTYSAMAGTPIFWIPANTSLSGATINVNGIGVVGLYNGNGTPISAGQIIAGYLTEIVYQANIAGSGNSGFVVLPGTSLQGVAIGTFGPEVPVASAATVDLGAAGSHSIQITGSTTISSFGSSASLLAPYYLIRFSGAMTLTYNASTLQLPGGTSITTSAGDSAIAQYLGGGAWRIAFYQYSQSASSNAKIKPADTILTSNATLTADPDLQTNTLAVGRYSYELLLIFDSVAAGAGFQWTNDGTLVDSRGLMPGLVSGFVNGVAVGPASSSFYSTTITYATVGTGANANQVLYKGSILVGTAGTLGIKWAQAASTASATTLRAGSYLLTTLLNTGSSANTVQHLYQTAGTFTETIPTGYTTLTIECWGGAAGGGLSNGSGMTLIGGGGGGSGGYSRSVVTVTGLGGDTLSFTVGAGGAALASGSASSVSSGTLAITTLTGNGGTVGGNATGIVGGAGGAGGTATGGTAVNTTGNTGSAGQTQSGSPQGAGGNGGAGISGIFYGGNAGGRGGGLSGLAQAGGVGIVLFQYQ